MNDARRNFFVSVRKNFYPAPPTVIASIFSEGWPTPTGTDCPALPQVPTPSSIAKSFPIIEMRVHASSARAPISVAFFTGGPTLPSSTR